MHHSLPASSDGGRQLRSRKEAIRKKTDQLYGELERWASETLDLKPGERVSVELIVSFSAVKPVDVFVETFDLSEEEHSAPPSADEWRCIFGLYPVPGPCRSLLTFIREQNGAPFSESAVHKFIEANLSDPGAALGRSWPQTVNSKLKKNHIPFRLRPVQMADGRGRETIRIFERIKT